MNVFFKNRAHAINLLTFFALTLFSLFGIGGVYAYADLYTNTGELLSTSTKSYAGTTGTQIASVYAILGFIVAFLALALLIVLFVSSKAFPRKEFMGVAWPLVKRYFWSFFGIMVVWQILVNLPSVVLGIMQALNRIPEGEPISAFFSYVVMTVISTILQAGLISIMLTVIDGGAPRFSDLFSQVRLFWRYLAGSILYGLIVFGGILLLVVPGVVWSFKFSLWPYFLVDKNTGVIEAFKMSSRATAGYKRSLFVLSIYLTALNLLGSAALLVGLFVTIPITLLTFAWVYRRLSSGIAVPAVAPVATVQP